jgi:hypothetical protein
MRDGKWNLLDPPVPRVSSQGLRQAFVTYSLRLPLLSDKTSKSGQKHYGGIMFMQDWISEQLSVLDALI